MGTSKESNRLTFSKTLWRRAILRDHILVNELNIPIFLCYCLHSRFSYYLIFFRTIIGTGARTEGIHGGANMAVQEIDMIET